MATARSTKPGSSRAVTLLLALLLAVGGVAVVGTAAYAAAPITKKVVKKIAAKVAKKEIAKAAPTLSVAHASTADAATNATNLGGSPAAEYAKAGVMQLTVAPLEWQLNTLGGTFSIDRYSNSVQVKTTAVGNGFLHLGIQAPVATNGTRLSLTSVRWCYSASTQAHVVNESLRVVTYLNGEGAVANQYGAANMIDLTNSGCRTIAVNRVLDPNDTVVLFLQVSTTNVSGVLSLGSVSATFTPTATTAGAQRPSGPSGSRPDAGGPGILR